MSYPAQAPVRRPRVLWLAVALLAVMAIGALGYALAGLLIFGGVGDRLREAAVGAQVSASEVDMMATLVRTSILVSVMVSGLAGLLLAGLALGVAAGRQGARVGTWVVAGLGMLFGCCGLVVQLLQRATPIDFGNDQATAELFGLIGDAYPSWWIPLTVTLSVGQVLGYLVVAIVLALPSVGASFRRPTPPVRAPAPPPMGPPPPPHHYPPFAQPPR
ncbi:hypothetical protein ACGFIK_09915 [Micromonospora sp. NPDC048871]|uniref:hypothetical protein n=1 Tax=unclassified Micromonospora TaxID=2617518 RepID=UPI002E161641|nr:hypothetical protein OIE53_21925 [Micromonospora sp. NBC_01739]